MTGRGGDKQWYTGFGLLFTSDFPLPGLPPAEPDGRASLELRLASPEDVAAAWSGPAPGAPAAQLLLDGISYRAERGAAGDHRFRFGDRAAFHLSARGHTLLCAPALEEDPSWRRVLLDSVLGTVSLLRGFETLHAAAVGTAEGVVAFVARTGGGKTTTAVELLRRGLPLVCDDLLALSRSGGRVVGHPAPPLMNVPAAAEPPDGTALAVMGEETWLAVDHVAAGPAPVAAVFLLDRRPGAQPRVVRHGGGLIDLVVHALRSGSTQERLQARFDLLSDLAALAPIHLLEADPSTPPEHLADLARGAFPALAPVPAGAAR